MAKLSMSNILRISITPEELRNLADSLEQRPNVPLVHNGFHKHILIENSAESEPCSIDKIDMNPQNSENLLYALYPDMDIHLLDFVDDLEEEDVLVTNQNQTDVYDKLATVSDIEANIRKRTKIRGIPLMQYGVKDYNYQFYRIIDGQEKYLSSFYLNMEEEDSLEFFNMISIEFDKINNPKSDYYIIQEADDITVGKAYFKSKNQMLAFYNSMSEFYNKGFETRLMTY